MTEDEYAVYLVPFSGDIRAAVRLDAEGYPSIYINEALSPEARKKAFLHELHHIKNGDFYSDRPLEEIEDEADRAAQAAYLEDEKPRSDHPGAGG